MSKQTARSMQDNLLHLLTEMANMDEEDRSECDMDCAEFLEGAQITTYRDAGIMTTDKGLVIEVGRVTFQITIKN